MVRVSVDDIVLAESENTVVVEGNHYFPPADVKLALFFPSDTTTVCPWKGTASYYSVNINGRNIQDVAWFYPATKEKAKNIEGYIAFYKNKVQITE
ncbi:DUF427-domain-containing protein [Fomitiporia mediterranea MF3/22]|uniref:DUF427-domain-containing protein n=1 Tax=Fomitiporia mediterranea (strain MF3/22) TaxID=694068 RepID=UPI0004408649|nr:DUF427-domain-containing protein [Fomitiporia mediterranea MF3/22]EJC97987.1 DUF427-domain-containing protein [Fomitiporia mediterranea MF3/22]